MSLPEVLLWRELRGSPLGLRFRRQHPVPPYVADFYCSALRLVVEVDGAVHDAPGQPARDALREAYFSDQGLKMVRLAAAEILRNPGEAVAAIVALLAPPLHQPAAGPPPRAGED